MKPLVNIMGIRYYDDIRGYCPANVRDIVKAFPHKVTTRGNVSDMFGNKQPMAH